MKFYMHSEDPELTLVVKWEAGRSGKIRDLIGIFSSYYYERYPKNTDEDLAFTIKSQWKTKPIDLDKEVSAVLKDKEDVFVKIEKQTSSLLCDSLSDLKVNGGEKNGKQNPISCNKSTVLDSKQNAAIVHLSNQRIRKAIQIYKEMLAVYKNNIDALKGLICCYLKAERYSDAVTFCKRGLTIKNNDTGLLSLAGESYFKAGNGDAAIEHLLKLCKILRQNGVASASEKQDIQVLLAKSYLVEDQRDMAITILQGVLRENADHTEALAEYAAILYTIGNDQHKEEAVSAILTALVNKRNDKDIKQKFADMMMTKDGINVLKRVTAKALADASALMFLAITLRDFGGIEQALDLLETATSIPESSAVCVLTYVHTLELVERHTHAMKQLLQYCETYPCKSVKDLCCSELIPYLKSFVNDSNKQDTQADPVMFSSTTHSPPQAEYSDEDLYILALFFTVVKIFYIKGFLGVLPSLIELIQPFFEGRNLHLTLIRNEAAYFKCVSEVLKSYPEITSLSTQKTTDFIYFIGDSHCIPAAWQKTMYKGTEYTLSPILSTGTKIWHLRPESVFYPKTNFMSVIKNIPDGSIVTVCLGEIDCRESFLQCWEKAKYDTIEEAMEVVVTIYIKLLKSLQRQHNWTLFVHPVLPVLDLTRPIVMQFNRILATRLQVEPNIKWLNFVNRLLTPDGEHILDDFKLDGTHMHPRYLKLFSEALNKH